MVKTQYKKSSTSHALFLGRKAGVANLIFMTDSERVHNPVDVCRRMPAGSIIICRDYSHADRMGLALTLRTVTKELNQFLLVAGDVVLAHSVRADGYHIPEYQLDLTPNLAGFGIVSAACHSLKAIRAAERLSVDFSIVSPVFKTKSHPESICFGVHKLKRLLQATKMPVAALGGINKNTAGSLKGLPLMGIGAIGAFLEE